VHQVTGLASDFQHN